MYKNSFQNQNDNFKSNPYRAKNMIIKKAEAPATQPPSQGTPATQPPVPGNPVPQQPAQGTPPAQLTPEAPAIQPPGAPQQQPAETPAGQPSIGHVAVGVFTALGALPVKDAVVTVYLLDENGEERAIYHRVTDESGRVPDMELQVYYDPNNPLVSPEFYFTTYDLRVQAINYYTQNILDFRVFPGVKTNLKINLIPVIKGEEEGTAPSRTIVIPPSPIDISNPQ